MNRTVLKKGLWIGCFAAALCAGTTAAAEPEKKAQDVGLVTGISYSTADKSVTVTVAFGTMKEMQNAGDQQQPKTGGQKARKADEQEPPKQLSAEDMITLSGGTAAFTLPADTALSVGMPPKAGSDDDTSLPPPPDGGAKTEKHFPRLTVKNILVDDIVTIRYGDDGKTVTGVTAAMLCAGPAVRPGRGRKMKRQAAPCGCGETQMNGPDDQRDPDDGPQD